MFIEIVVKDSILIQPHSLGNLSNDDERLKQVLEDEIRRKYGNRVLTKHGLCIGVENIREIGAGAVFPGLGGAMVECVFTLVMFNPRIGDILVATPICSFEDGLILTVGFFQDIHIETKHLPKPSL
jgi:DNA-directed RNA polymerase III subunit RPC8